MARAQRLGGRGVQPPKKNGGRSLVYLWGIAAPNGVGSQAWGTGSPAQPVVAAHGALVGDCSPQWHGLTGWGDGEASPTGGCSLRCARGGWQPPMVRGHRLGAWEVQFSQWSQPTERLKGMAAPNGAGPQAGGGGGAGSATQPVVPAHGAPMGDIPTSLGGNQASRVSRRYQRP